MFFLNIMVWKGFSQYSGSLMMFPDNFYSQIMNPAYTRTDQATSLAVPGLAGLSFKNTGNFKISDVISVSSDGKPEWDFERFYNKSKPNNFIGQNLSFPLIFISTPAKGGFFSFYYQERAQVFSRFNSASIEYINNGNIPPEYRNFSTENLNSVGLGFHEFAFGYAQSLNQKINIGFRGKLLFGGVYYSAQNWEYGILTSESGDKVTLTSSGTGEMSFPIPVYLSNKEQVYYIDKSHAIGKYLASYNNPGIAVDLGITWNIDESNIMSLAIRDLGGIWFRKNGFGLTLNGNYDYAGFDLENAIRFLEENGYVNPLTSVMDTKEEIRNVYRPFADFAKFIKPMSPQTIIHYQLKYSPKLEIGITNQSIFQKKFFYNSMTITALQKWTNFSMFENINVNQLSSVSFGGGFQYTGKIAQVFLATDNLIAFYHPANNRTLSLSLGMCFLLNHEKGEGESKGKFLPYLPFYRIYD